MEADTLTIEGLFPLGTSLSVEFKETKSNVSALFGLLFLAVTAQLD